MSKDPLISVILVNYNSGEYLRGALASLAEQTFRDFEVIIIDNASGDGSLERASLDNLPECRIVRNDQNLGFAKANNQAASLARGRWLALLNPDSIAEKDWLEKLIEAANAFPGCVSFASAQLNLPDTDRLDGAGDAYFFAGIPWRGGHGRAASEMPESGWCFSACGAGAMYEAQTFRETGGFDERFFCYCEDVDYGFRLQLMGHDSRFVREAVIRHAGSALSGRDSPFTIYHGTRNRIWTYVKNMPALAFWMTLPVHFLLSLYLLARSAFTPRFRPMLKGLVDGLKEAPGMRAAGRQAAARRRQGLPSLLGRMSWNPARLSRRGADIRQDPPIRLKPED